MDCKEKLPSALMKGYSRKFEKGLESMSPFEIKNKLIEFAEEHTRKAFCLFLNAGRGNPNWIATVPREAFFLLGKFGLEECRRVFDLSEGIAGIPVEKGIAKRFEDFIQQHKALPGADLLKEAYHYFVDKKRVDPDSLIHEWAEAIIGDQYPVPDRMLKYAEMIVHDYLLQEMCDRQPVNFKYDLFATEGGTAAMCYIFDSLQENRLLAKGDRVALMTPIFTPYIEIPELDRFQFQVTKIQASQMTETGLHTWQYPDSELDKLKDKSIKVLYIVNPSNPPSYTLDKRSLDKIVDIVKKDNPHLMIITDDVYATFIPHFRSMMAELPKNTLCVYSFSKYFGATGWRLAIIALHQDNIYDRMIRELPRDKQELLKKRYSSLSLHPEDIRFIDRMVADSRQVALNHTAGLSLPQQTQMSLFASFALLDAENTYKKRMQDMIHERLHTLWESTGFTLLDDPLRAGYYSEIDMLVWAKKFYGDDFVEYLKKNYEPLDVVFRLAQETSLVLLNGGGFDAPEWSIRASLANLKREDYVRIGKGIASILHSYAQRWKESLDK
mgnify:CR=1 FL=1